MRRAILIGGLFFHAAFGLDNGAWSMTSTHGLPAQSQGYFKAVYAPSPIGKVLFRGMYHENWSEAEQAILGYSYAANRWDVLGLGEHAISEYMPESGHTMGEIAWEPLRKVLLMHCCFSGSNQIQSIQKSTFWFDPISLTGRWKRGLTAPNVGQLGSSAYDTANSTWVFFGGDSFVGTWKYNPATETYSEESTTGTSPDPSLNSHAMAFRPTNGKVYLFGGSGTGSHCASYCNGLYTFDAATDIWADITPVSSPPVRKWAAFAYDSTNDVFLLFGGTNGSTLTDTWVFNPNAGTWTELAISGPSGGQVPWESLVYDSDNNVFVLLNRGSGGFADGTWTHYAIQTWLFRYGGTGPDPGTESPSYSTTTGIQRNATGWAKEAVIAAGTSSLYAAWSEFGTPFDATDAAWAHAYAGSYGGSSWSALGGQIDTATTSAVGMASLVAIDDTPWITYVTAAGWRAEYKYRSGSSWVGGSLGVCGVGTTIYQTRSAMANVNGTPYVAILEVDKDTLPVSTRVCVKYWDGDSWETRGTTLNIAASSTIATSLAIASDGTNAVVAWTEYTASALNPILYVKRWNGSSWASLGSGVSGASAWADGAALVYVGGAPYVAWTERASVAGLSQLYVKSWGGSSWDLVGSGSLNRSGSNAWAWRPSLDTDGTNLYLAWPEQEDIGYPVHVYVSRWNGSSWAALGGSLNRNTSGSAERVSLVWHDSAPWAAWSEVVSGTTRQVYAQEWGPSHWIAQSSSGVGSTFRGSMRMK